MMLKALSLEDQLRAWLDGKSGPYNYHHCKECALAQFLRDIHGPDANIRVDAYWYTIDKREYDIPLPLATHLMHGRTFEGLRALIDEAA